MTANTLAVCVQNMGCDKQCPYCVSKMTWSPEPNAEAVADRISKVAHFATMAQVTDVIVTGKGEPCLSWEALTGALDVFQPVARCAADQRDLSGAKPGKSSRSS